MDEPQEASINVPLTPGGLRVSKLGRGAMDSGLRADGQMSLGGGMDEATQMEPHAEV